MLTTYIPLGNEVKLGMFLITRGFGELNPTAPLLFEIKRVRLVRDREIIRSPLLCSRLFDENILRGINRRRRVWLLSFVALRILQNENRTRIS